jgi:hypothetical protein
LAAEIKVLLADSEGGLFLLRFLCTRRAQIGTTLATTSTLILVGAVLQTARQVGARWLLLCLLAASADRK